MAYYRICPICGAYLDPDEECDCYIEQERREKEKKKRKEQMERFLEVERTGQIHLIF